MKLLIVSNMAHYRGEGQILGWGPAVMEIDHLAQLFDEIRHIACLHPEPAPATMLPYEAKNVTLILVPPAGGERLRSKLQILRHSPLYLRTVWRELRSADAVHIRGPANISLLTILLLTMVRHPRLRWVKYAGNWRPQSPESWSYTFQRWWLNKGWQGGVVTVNGQWPHQPRHVNSFLNPCLTETELVAGRAAAAEKHLTSPLRLLYVGRLEEEKGVGRAINILRLLRQRGVAAVLDLVGDGPERPTFEDLVATNGLGAHVVFHGWVARTQLGPLFSRAHVMVFPSSCSEGWPKVLSEGMAYGVVPLAGDVSSIPQFLRRFRTGRTFASTDVVAFVEALVWYEQHPERWHEESANGVQAARLFSYENYLQAVCSILNLPFTRRAEGYQINEISSASSSNPRFTPV
jgi:glycosyltransferase involved in cell wall biosynthesis